VAIRAGGRLVGGDCPGWVSDPACRVGGAGNGGLLGPLSTRPAILSGEVSYVTGAINVTFATPPPPGLVIAVDYIQDGWGYGSGLMDEDGRHGWIPSDPVRFRSSKALSRDLNGFLRTLAAAYFSTVTSTIRRYAPHNLVFGPGVLGTWHAPADKRVLEAAAPYVDGIAASIDYTRTQTELSYIAQYLGDKPMILWHGAHANADSALWRYPNWIDSPCNPCGTQAERAAYYTNSMNGFLNTTNTVYNDYTIIGFRWWAFTDSWAEKANWGLISLEDNPYDGQSAVVTPGTDPWGYATGGEEKNYGDLLGAARSSNLQWVGLTKR
jgi:hypothetical protein